MMFIKRYLPILFIYFTCTATSFAQTIIKTTPKGFQLIRNGEPYYVKGVGGQVNFDQMVAVGANSLRTWGVDDAQNVLDEAQKRGLTVMLGFWFGQERQGYDYADKDGVKRQLDYYKTVVDRYKNHPALLMYGIGNELDLAYTNTDVWYALQDMAKYIHQNDPNHPTSTVTAGLDSMEVQLITSRCPDIDIYCVNTYGDINNVPKNIARFGWKGPYMITEWGPNGHWESPTTSWGVSIEQTSTEKKMSYYTRFKNAIEPNKNYCLGSYVFLWGAKQEYTETWYGLFSKDNKPTEPLDAIEMVFTGKAIQNPAPTIVDFTIDGRKAKESIKLKAEDKYSAMVNAKLAVEIEKWAEFGDTKVQYRWAVLEESTDKKSGGDVENEANEVLGLIKTGKNTPNITFKTPNRPGQYRLFVWVTCNGKVAYANIPFLVEARSPEDGQATFVKFKTTNMASFKNQQ